MYCNVDSTTTFLWFYSENTLGNKEMWVKASKAAVTFILYRVISHVFYSLYYKSIYTIQTIIIPL